MASNKPQFPVDVPKTGVRQDVNPMLRSPEMAAKGDNCIYYDGTIRPRPALTKEVGTITPVDDTLPPAPLFPEFIPVWNGEVGTLESGATCLTDLGILLVSVDTADTWRMSRDVGQTWTTPAIDHPGADLIELVEKNEFLFAFSTTACYRAPIGTFPTSLTWTTIATGMNTMSGYSKFYYDDTNDAWVILNIGQGSGYSPAIHAIYDASATASDDQLTAGEALLSGETKWDRGGWVQDEWLVYSTDRANTQQTYAVQLKWVTDAYDYDTDVTHSFMSLSANYNPLGIGNWKNARMLPNRCPRVHLS